jgi:hypothetical protein
MTQRTINKLTKVKITKLTKVKLIKKGEKLEKEEVYSFKLIFCFYNI